MRIFIPVYIILFFTGLQHFFEWQSAGFILGLAALPFTMVFDKTRKGSRRYFYISLTIFLFFLLVPVGTFYYLALITAIAFCLEMYIGRMNVLPMYVMICMSPIFEHWSGMFTFPLRLQLTAIAGKILAADVQGNMILFEGQPYSVDPACMGLQMTVTAMLCGLIIMGGWQKKLGKRLSTWMATALLLLLFVLNTLANLLRIVLLVRFAVLPEQRMHGVIGVICLLVYVVLPFVLICRWSVSRYGKVPVKEEKIYRIVPTGPLVIRNGLLVACMVYACIVNLRPRIAKEHALPLQPVGYAVKLLPGGVTQLYNEHALLYLKYIPGYYYSEHHPMICWKGSGYNFERVQEQHWNGRDVYTATLVNGKTTLYTAWWYDNGKKGTISQLEWRSDVFLGGAPYSLVNITMEDEASLKQEVIRLRG
jgi:exosortase N